MHFSNKAICSNVFNFFFHKTRLEHFQRELFIVYKKKVVFLQKNRLWQYPLFEQYTVIETANVEHLCSFMYNGNMCT